MNIGEFFVKLGVNADNDGVKKFRSNIQSLSKGLVATQVAFVGAIVGLDRFVESGLKGVVALKNLNQQTGLSIKELQRWQQAGQLSNLSISADQIASSIGNLEKSLAAIRLGQGDVAPFQLLGIDVVGQDAFSVLDQLRDRLKGLDNATASNLISNLGLTPEFINILKLSRKEFDALAENEFLSKEQRDNIDDLGTSIKQITLRFKALKDQAVAKLAPELKELTDGFFRWMDENGTGIINIISGIASAFGAVVLTLGNAGSLLASFANGLLSIKGAVGVLSVGIAALAVAAAPLTAAFLGIILILDDIKTFLDGGDSYFGDLYKMFSGIKSGFKGLINDETRGNIEQSITFRNASPDLARDIFGDLLDVIPSKNGSSADKLFAEGMEDKLGISNSNNSSTNSTTTNITNNNNFDIRGNNAGETAIAVDQQLNSTQALINRGGY